MDPASIWLEVPPVLMPWLEVPPVAVPPMPMAVVAPALPGILWLDPLFCFPPGSLCTTQLKAAAAAVMLSKVDRSVGVSI
jgi:hypothetical protein